MKYLRDVSKGTPELDRQIFFALAIPVQGQQLASKEIRTFFFLSFFLKRNRNKNHVLGILLFSMGVFSQKLDSIPIYLDRYKQRNKNQNKFVSKFWFWFWFCDYLHGR